MITNTLELLFNDIFLGIVNRMQEFYGKYKPRYVFYTGFTPRVFHSKPEHIQYIVNSTVHINKSNSFQVLNYWLGEGIITSNGMSLYLQILLKSITIFRV